MAGRIRSNSVRQGHHLPRDVSDETVERLFAVIDDCRDYAIFTLMLCAGLRVGEVIALKLDDIQDDGKTTLTRLRVCGKCDKERLVWLTVDVMAQINQWR